MRSSTRRGDAGQSGGKFAGETGGRERGQMRAELGRQRPREGKGSPVTRRALVVRVKEGGARGGLGAPGGGTRVGCEAREERRASSKPPPAKSAPYARGVAGGADGGRPRGDVLGGRPRGGAPSGDVRAATARCRCAPRAEFHRFVAPHPVDPWAGARAAHLKQRSELVDLSGPPTRRGSHPQGRCKKCRYGASSGRPPAQKRIGLSPPRRALRIASTRGFLSLACSVPSMRRR